MTPADDLGRVLDALLHDLRSPMGVAGGYLRLLREGRLATPADSDRAISKTQDALRTMTALCAEAGEWLKEPPAPKPITVAAAELLASVETHAEELGIDLDIAPGEATGQVQLTVELERVAATVAGILRTAIGSGEGRCLAGLSHGVLHIIAIVPAKTGTTGGAGEFDPWAYPGLSTALSCRMLEQAGGRCRRGDDDGEVMRVEFDLTTAA